MKFTQVQLAALVASMAAAQTLNIPTRVGEITSLPEPSIITGSEDFGNKEFDRGQPCDSDEDTGSDNAVFILQDGASLSNVIIGADALEGVHCLGSCTLTNVWFRDVCEDAISVLGTGDATIIGGGAQEAIDKVVQHNGAGTVTIRNYTIVNAGKLYRSCGDCTNNESKSPRKVIVENVRAFGVKSDLVGINSNFGDEATISGSCGVTKNVCQEYKGVNKGSGSSSKVDTKTSCKGAQGQIDTLPACDAEPEVPSETAEEQLPEETAAPSPTESEPAPEETEVEEEGEEAPITTAAPSTLLTLTKTSEESAPTEGSAGSVARWGRCGGIGYTGPTTCAEGSVRFRLTTSTEEQRSEVPVTVPMSLQSGPPAEIMLRSNRKEDISLELRRTAYQDPLLLEPRADSPIRYSNPLSTHELKQANSVFWERHGGLGKPVDNDWYENRGPDGERQRRTWKREIFLAGFRTYPGEYYLLRNKTSALILPTGLHIAPKDATGDQEKKHLDAYHSTTEILNIVEELKVCKWFLDSVRDDGQNGGPMNGWNCLSNMV
ncbi:hypothetical protein OPT61_g494 [Boeremia exigua]|uniref:Uncharacterized protein n=1 Tax=Boeremia exigua TaxID=749465 RepID=A0ACC2ITQ8_9PLEO|nr:hypothetical protein OPT61_g494 [Boeremia exigua]